MYNSLFKEPSKVYHKRASEYMSSHRLAAIRRGEEYDSSDKPAYKLGRWVHTYVLEGREQFFVDCLVGGPINHKTGKSFGVHTQAYSRFAEDRAHEIVPADTYDQIRRMNNAVRSNRAAAEFLSRGHAELVGRCSYRGVNCQIRCDWLTPKGQLVDLKTCRSLETFRSDCLKYEYIHQLAFYREMLRILTGQDIDCFIIAVEKTDEPIATTFDIDDMLLSNAQLDNELALLSIKEKGGIYVCY